MLGFRKTISFRFCLSSLLLFLFIGAIFLFVVKGMKENLWWIGGSICLTSLIHWLIVLKVFGPAQKIIQALKSYEQGKEELLPTIFLDDELLTSDFGRLATTLNSLGKRVKNQIEHLSSQTREKEEILESLGEGVVAVDAQARVQCMNTTACTMLKINKAKAFSQRVDSFMGGEDSFLLQECHELILHALQSLEPTFKTLRIQENPPLFLDLFAAPLASQKGAVLVLQDKTHAYQILEMGKDFIANASHELRTPITIIRGFAETLQDAPDLSSEMISQITEKIVRTCIRLEKLVKSLITLSDTEHISEKRFQSVDLLLLAKKSKEHLLSVDPEVKIEIKTELKEALIFADMDLVELAIINLLENALKYSALKAPIEIMIEEKEGSAFLHVKDQGIGISEFDLPHIFERFYTVDKARSRKLGGAGLGLSIVKNIVEKHKGKVFARSELGRGSTFTLCFPLKNS